MDRKVWAFALVGVAVRVILDNEQRVTDARLVLSGVAPVPWRVEAAEQALIGKRISNDVVTTVAETALARAQPLDSNTYKVQLARGLIRRALSALSDDLP